ncbi:heme exporter protein CcmD [Rhizobium sp. L1K21]|uniref:heme exporter protein CcmD n=1 Tax=Rhizobium sp. L1K21 TaxID=2954933 RepID=UPI0020921236|nr:heme exporter protein CcmD [Rhizobium sp. L1K21]MCO6188077.1 heme exporter protein CcmD [Rhizobium sp. L1K21]
MSHAFYIYASYGIAALTIVGIVVWTWLDSRARRKELQKLEASGIRRRSAGSAEGAK